MSFSGEIKEELSRQSSSGRHCRVAETAAILSLCGKVLITESNQYCVKIQTENLPVARKYFTLLKKTLNIRSEVSVRKNREAHSYSVLVRKIMKQSDCFGKCACWTGTETFMNACRWYIIES